MKQASIFLFTDHEVGCGVTVAKAMACGLPVVEYDNGFWEVYTKMDLFKYLSRIMIIFPCKLFFYLKIEQKEWKWQNKQSIRLPSLIGETLLKSLT